MARDRKAMVRFSIALMWWGSALLPIIPSVFQRAMHELSLVGLTGLWAWVLMGLAMLLDFMCGLCALRSRQKWVWWMQVALVIAYTVILSISHADLWLDPFGALLKNLPIIALLVYMAQTEEVA